MTEPTVGQPGFGVERPVNIAPPEEPKRKGPDWDKFMDPKKYIKQSNKPRPTETGVNPPLMPPPPTPAKKLADK